jgi:misacylated tRNA(Ala) deacylase
MTETKALYLEDSYLKEWEAEILEVSGEESKEKAGKFIILDQTAFYPNSGGQPYDTGKIIRLSDNAEFQVVYVGKFEGKISHEIDKPGLKVGDKIKCFLDWDRRYKLMRMHTAAHILSPIIHMQTQALVTGNQLGIDKSHVDFDLEDFDKEAFKEYIKSANEIVSWNLPLKSYYISQDQLANDKSLCKLAKGLPPDLKEIRIIEIESFDKQADGGTHVKSTSEAGKIVFLSAENRGAKRRRVYFTLEN